MLFGAIDNSVKYGNPVSDYIPDFYKCENSISPINNPKDMADEGNGGIQGTIDDEGEKVSLIILQILKKTQQK